MPVAENKKSKINHYIYEEVLDKLEKYFNHLSVPYMPINGAYFYYAGYAQRLDSSPVFSAIEIVLRENDYAGVIEYLDGIPVASKTVALGYKSAYTFFVESIGVIRVDIYCAVPFPGKYVLGPQELFLRGIKMNGSNRVLPSREHALLVLMKKCFDYNARFFNDTLLDAANEIVSPQGFFWDTFLDSARKSGMQGYGFYFLERGRKKCGITLPSGKVPLYPKLAAGKLMQFFYRQCPVVCKKIFFKAFLVDNSLEYLIKHSMDTITRNINSACSSIYKAVIRRFARKYIIDNEIYVFNAVTGTAKNRLSAFELNYRLDEDFILGTSSGIWYMRNGMLYQLTYGSTYGIAYDGKKWYASQGLGQYSRIITFGINESGERAAMVNVAGYIKGLPRNIHQIEYCNELLYAADTQNNRIIIIDKKKKVRYYFPNRAIRSNKNNNHFNSIFITDAYVYICAHNGTFLTGKNSEIYILDKESMQKREVIATEASCAHNIIYHNGNMLYCDSAGGKLICNGTTAFEDKRYFMRGLAFTDKYILAGGSQFARREERQGTDSVVNILDTNFRHIYTIPIKGLGQLYEIRGVINDHGLSINTQ